MKYRSRTDIVSQMLEAAEDGATKTRLMYGAYLSYEQLKEYLSLLGENELLAFDEESRTYRTTEKGHRFLEIYDQIGNIMRPSAVQA